MARKASAAQVKADISPPDFRGAVTLLRGIKPKKDKVSSINGEIGGILDRVDGMKVDKKAARVFNQLDAMEREERLNFMRSLNGLIDGAKQIGSGDWSDGADLVDQSQGNVVRMKVGGKGAPEDDAGNDGSDDGSGDGSSADANAPRTKFSEALDDARAHLGTGAPETEKSPGDDVMED